VGVIVVALPTLFALVPQHSVPNLSFRLGLLLNEVPIVGFYRLVFDTALAFAHRSLPRLGAIARGPVGSRPPAGVLSLGRGP
jgi:hypothetical protein